MKYSIREYGDPVLREVAKPVTSFDSDLKQLAEDMLESMYDAEGIGLAAQQIGKTDDLFLLDVPAEGDVDEHGVPNNPEAQMPLVLINAKQISTGEYESPYEEGCLSFPDINGNVVRSEAVEIEFQDVEGQVHTLKAKGLLARAIQHEMDHLQGILFIDHMSKVKRMSMAGKLKRLKNETRSSLGLNG